MSWANIKFVFVLYGCDLLTSQSLFVCQSFRGHVETNSMLPLLPSHLPLTHWCLPGASGPRLWLWLSVGETLLPSSAVCYRQGHTVWLQTHLPSSTSPDFCPLNVPCIMSHSSSTAVRVCCCVQKCGEWPLDFSVLVSVAVYNFLVNLVCNLHFQIVLKFLLIYTHLVDSLIHCERSWTDCIGAAFVQQVV